MSLSFGRYITVWGDKEIQDGVDNGIKEKIVEYYRGLLFGLLVKIKWRVT